MNDLPPEQLAILAREDQGPLTKSIVIAFAAISFTCVCLRIFTRLKYMGRVLGWEDYTIIVSMLFAIVTTVFQILQTNAGNGKHATFIEFPAGVVVILRYLYWSIIMYNASLMFTKISILLQYGRIFTLREMRIPLHIVMGICVSWGITTIFTSIFTCVPVNAYWQVLEQASARCIKNKTIWYVNAGINIFTDLLVASLPIKVIWGLQIPLKQRIALLGILTIGWFVCVVSILRLHALIVLAAHPKDQTWYSAATAYWSAIEMNLAIVCASLPALKPLVVKVIPAFSTRYGSRGYGSRGYGTGTSGKKKSHGYGSGSGSGSRTTRQTTGDDEVELERALSTKAYPSTSADSVYGKNIYVSRQFEQHFEETGHISDSESQKDLVRVPKSALETC